MKADAGEQVQRPVRAEEVAASQVDECAWRDFELLLRGPSLDLARHDPQPPLDASAISKCRRRRFLDGDEQVAAGLVAVPQLGQLGCAAKQLERRQPALALELRFE